MAPAFEGASAKVVTLKANLAGDEAFSTHTSYTHSQYETISI